MNSYAFPIKMAFFTFPFIAAFITLPFLIFQYKKYGYLNKFRAFILYSFLLYLITAYYLIILPLPASRDVKSLQLPGTIYYQLTPFNFIRDMIKESKVVFGNKSTYITIFKERAFLQAAFNGVLLTPLGIYLRYYFNKGLKQTLVMSFLMSLFFELTQLTALYGIYNAPYRLFDVDDLILNTLGGLIGYIIAPMFAHFLPKAEELDENVDLSSMPIGIIRRGIAFSIDWSIVSLILTIFKREQELFSKAILIFIYFILLVYATNGRTFGKWLVRIKVKGKEEKLKFLEVFKRYGILYYGITGLNYIMFQVITLNGEKGLINIVVIFVMMVFNIIIAVNVVINIFSKQKLFFYEKISGTRNAVITNNLNKMRNLNI